MRHGLTAFAAVLLIGVSTAFTSAGTARRTAVPLCPPEYGSTREVALIFLADSGYIAEASALGLSAADTADLVLLNDTADQTACVELNAAMAEGDMGDYPNVHSYYRVGDYFLIAIGVHPDAETTVENGVWQIRIDRSAVAVLDASYSVVGFYPI